MREIVIREAKPTVEEGLLFARFFDETAEGFFTSILGKQAYELISRAYVKPGNSYSYKNVSFAESDSEIIGMVSGYSTADKSEFYSRTLKDLWEGGYVKIGIFSLIERFLSRHLGPRGDGDFYIQAIIVDEKMRGHGVGRKLMEYIENRAGERGFATLSLDVSGRNHKAIALYEKSSMIIETYWPHSPLLPHIFTRMIKDVTP